MFYDETIVFFTSDSQDVPGNIDIVMQQLGRSLKSSWTTLSVVVLAVILEDVPVWSRVVRRNVVDIAPVGQVLIDLKGRNVVCNFPTSYGLNGQ